MVDLEPMMLQVTMRLQGHFSLVSLKLSPCFLVEPSSGSAPLLSVVEPQEYRCYRRCPSSLLSLVVSIQLRAAWTSMVSPALGSSPSSSCPFSSSSLLSSSSLPIPLDNL